jgi:hypothetical protein
MLLHACMLGSHAVGYLLTYLLICLLAYLLTYLVSVLYPYIYVYVQAAPSGPVLLGSTLFSKLGTIQ